MSSTYEKVAKPQQESVHKHNTVYSSNKHTTNDWIEDVTTTYNTNFFAS